MKWETSTWSNILYVFDINSLQEFWIIQKRDIPLFYWSKIPNHRTEEESDIMANFFAALRKIGESMCQKIEIIHLQQSRIFIFDSFNDFFLVGKFKKGSSNKKMKSIMNMIGSQFELQFTKIISGFEGEITPFNHFHLWFF